jgi:hypothetical protein
VAAADGLVAKASDLTPARRALLQGQITTFRAEHPEAFEAVRHVEGYKPEHYMQRRNPVPAVGLELRRLGPRALLPMLEALAFDVWPRDGATDREWNALRIGMLEAVGHLRDARASDVLRVAFLGAHRADVTRAAAEAMGLLCDKPSFTLLTDALSGTKRGAAIAGLGHCRTLEAAKLLAGQLKSAKSSGEASEIAAAMGQLGSSWAWEAMGAEQAALALRVREVLATELVRGFVRYSDRLSREAHSKSLGMVAHPSTSALVARYARDADAATRARLERVAARIARRSHR